MRILFQWLNEWLKANSVMLVNASSLIGTTAVTSILGFVYWWVAARRFPPAAVGIASASISAMTLLGSFCILGLGTLLITELSRQPDKAESLISTALIIVGGIGGCVGGVFAVIASYVLPGFKPFDANVFNLLIFALGVSLSSITLVLDAAFIGLLHGGLQFWRNTLLAIFKLVLLYIATLMGSGEGSMVIYVTWVIGNALSLVAIAAIIISKKGWPRRKHLPQWGFLRKLGFAALQHHLLNVVLQSPVLILPVLVATLLSSTMNAWFYVAWMVASIVFLLPNVLTIVLHAMNSAQQATLARKARVTMSLGLLICLVANCLLQLAATPVLGVFGKTYAEQAALTLHILLLAAFPLIIKYHYIAICRIHDRIAQAMWAMLPGGLIELGAAIAGAHFGNLVGLCLGWVIAIYIESLFMFLTVFKVVRGRTSQTTDTLASPLAGDYTWTDRSILHHEGGIVMTQNTQALKVLMVTPRYFPYIGGIETHVHEVGRRLVCNGVDVTLLTTVPPNLITSLPREDEIEGMHVIRVQAWPPQRDYYIAPEIYSIITHGKWDLVHCQGCHTFVPPLAMYAAQTAKIPYLVTFHTGGHSSRWRTSIRGIQWRLLRPLMGNASKLIGVSRFEVTYFQQILRIPAHRFAVIPNGATLPCLPHGTVKALTQPLIISVGRLERYKGHQRLITALREIHKRRPDTRLLIVGAGPYETTLRELAQTMGVAEYVEIRAVPASDRQGMAELLSQATLVALLSEYEAHPIAVMEALALQRPVLVTNTSGLREIAEQGLARAIPLKSTPEEVARAALQQMEEPLTPPAHLELPTWDDCARQLESIYTLSSRRVQCVS